MEEDDNEDENALFEEEGLEDLDSHTPPHLRAIADASQQGDLDALRLALGTPSPLNFHTHFSLPDFLA